MWSQTVRETSYNFPAMKRLLLLVLLTPLIIYNNNMQHLESEGWKSPQQVAHPISLQHSKLCSTRFHSWQVLLWLYFLAPSPELERRQLCPSPKAQRPETLLPSPAPMWGMLLLWSLLRVRCRQKIQVICHKVHQISSRGPRRAKDSH